MFIYLQRQYFELVGNKLSFKKLIIFLLLLIISLPFIFSIDLVSNSYTVGEISSDPLTAVELISTSFTGESSSQFISSIFNNESIPIEEVILKPSTSSTTNKKATISNSKIINETKIEPNISLTNYSLKNSTNSLEINDVNNNSKSADEESPKIITGNVISENNIQQDTSLKEDNNRPSPKLNLIFLISISLITILLGLIAYGSYIKYTTTTINSNPVLNEGTIAPQINVGEQKISSNSTKPIIVDEIKEEFLSHNLFERIINNEISEELHELMLIHEGKLIQRIKESPSEKLMYERMLLSISRAYHSNFHRINKFHTKTADDVILKNFFLNIPKYIYVLKKNHDNKILMLIAKQTKYVLNNLGKNNIEGKK